MCFLDKINVLQKQIYESKLDFDHFLNLLEDEGLMDKIYEKIRDLEFYSINGLLHTVLGELMYINGSSTLLCYNSEEEFINLIDNGFKKFYTPTIITLPINVIVNGDPFSNIPFNNQNINIFSNNEQGLYLLNEYFNDNIYADFNSEYIIRKNDNNFINYPLMTIFVEGLEYNVNIEAPKIVEAIYSIIRMSTMHQGKHCDIIRDLPTMGATYSVNYNVINSPNQQISKSCYGYSYRIGFANILDMSVKEIENNKVRISELITKLIDYTFYNKNLNTNQENEKRRKWTNALLLFNEAYELASIEKYDTANLLLLTILESFFIPEGSGSKKKKLMIRVPPIVKNKFDEVKTSTVIKHTYEARNDFVHDGKRMMKRLKYKPINDTIGLIRGLEPLNFTSKYYEEDGHDLYYLSILFEIVIYCITKCYDEIASEYILK